MKRLFTLILVFLLLLTGCDSNKIKAPEILSPEAVVKNRTQYYPEKVDSPEGIPVLKLFFIADYTDLGHGGNGTCNPAVITAVNAYLEENNMPFRIQVVQVTDVIGEGWATDRQVLDAMEEADLIYNDFTPDMAKAYLEPITQYVTGSDAPLADAVPHEKLWTKATADGEIYGIPYIICSPTTSGWQVSEKVIKRYGFTVEDFARGYAEMDSVFAELYEKNGNVPFLMTFTSYSSGGSIDGTDVYMLGDVLNNIEGYNYITACYGLDAYAETPVIENILDSERVRTYFETEQRYKDAGYSFDASSEDYPCLVTSGLIMRNTPYYEDGYWYIPSGSLHWTETRPCGKMLGIAKNSTHQTEAAAFLELIAKDVQFRKLLCFGREGIDYTVRGGKATYNESSKHDLSFLSPMADFSGMDTGAFGWGLTDFPLAEGEDPLTVFREMMDECEMNFPLDCMYGFDTSALKGEIAAVNEIVRDYHTKDKDDEPGEIRFSGKVDASYEEMIRKVKAAGGDRIQAELQRQLDEWLAANPDWNK